MNRVDAAPELLQGVTALRLGLVDREGLTAGLIAWNATGGRGPSLTSLLVGRGLLRADRLPLLEAEVANVLRAHGGSTERALAEAGPLATEFGRLLESDPFQTLSDVGTETEFESNRAHPGESPGLPGTLDDLNPATEPIVNGSSPPSSLKMPTGPDPFATIADEPTNGNAPPETIATDSPDSTIAHSKTVDGAPLPSTPGSDYFNLRYQVLRMHAKGGLGQVFVARDSELNREVALKEIQGKYADQQESRLRFLVEAEVTGGLEHPGIVPVYGLGRYPDGRPYYAMRFIRGESMKEAIEQFHHGGTGRDPSVTLMELRKLLGQLVDVCNAMSYAHSRGVLHRDLKPGNIMLGSFGETLVVDWGLAKFKDAPEGTEISGPHAPIRPMSAGSTSRTLFGSAVGTPQFMSPEQAAGQLDKLGPASDIYSLGVILYAILTGESAFPDKSLTTILDKVRKGEFSPPKAVNHATHPALNAICLKAMALRSEDRYRSARDLADDIEHWLADEPVSVYREPFLTRVARWAKRHKTAVASVAALLITALVSLGIYSVLIKQEQARTARFYGLARFAVDKMLTELGQEDLADIPQMELVRRKMLTEAQTFYTRLLTERGNDPSARDDVARAGIRLGDIETLLGEDAKAETHYGKAITTLQAIHKGKPDDRSYRDDLGRAYHSRGLLLRKLNRLKEAESDFNEALKYRTDLTRDAPATTSYQRDRIDTLYHLAALHAKLAADAGSRAKVQSEYQEVIKAQEAIADGPESTLDDRRLLGRYLNNLAILLNVETSDRKDALDTFRKAEAIQADVVKRQPQIAITRYELAKTNGNMHLILAAQKNPEKSPEAEERGRRNVEILRQLTQEFRNITDFREGLVAADLNLGKYLLESKRLDLAGKELDEAITLGTDLVKTHGERRECRAWLGTALFSRGILEDKIGKPEAAGVDFQAALETLKPLGEARPPVVADLISLGNVHYQLAYLRKGDPKLTAISELDQAIVYHKQAGSNVPLWLAYRLKFRLLKQRTDPGVLKDLEEAVAIGSSLVNDHAESRECRSVLATARLSQGVVLNATGQPAKAEEDLLKARDLLKPQVETENVEDANELGLVHYNLALVRDKLGHADEAMADLEDAIRIHERTGATPSTTTTEAPQLWYDLELKCKLLAKRKPPRDYLAEAEAAERLPTLRPNHADSAIRAARSLARCTYDVAYEGKPDNPAVRAKQREYASRTLKVLQSAAERGVIQSKALNEELYRTIKDRPEFAKIREILEQKP